MDAWLAGEEDTIWISEVADSNDRVALLTLSFDLEPWLAGEHVDSLRAQSLEHWKQHNQKAARSVENQIKRWAGAPLQRQLERYFEKRLDNPPKQVETDGVLRQILPGLEEEFSGSNHGGAGGFPAIFQRLVEDRATQVSWSSNPTHAKWFVFQSFRKLPSPGRVYRFWRTAEAFFDELLTRYREIASAHENRWRTRRLLLYSDTAAGAGTWEDRETYLGHWRGAPLELVYLDDRQAFVTASNLARCFAPEETNEALKQATQAEPLELKGDDGETRVLKVKSVSTPDAIGVYAPVIPLDRSPLRFRVLVPLERATACIEAAIAKWREEFARVWDRMPLRIGVLAFPRMTPVQAVIEAARNLEDALERDRTQTWRVIECRTREGMTALSLEHESERELVLVPTQLPDGRHDVFYPYVQVEDRELRAPRDFQHPDGRVYRHMADLRPGDGLAVHPSRIATVFLDTTARRFERPKVRLLSDFERMRAVWDLLVRTSPSLTALRGAWLELEDRKRSWRGTEGQWLPEAEAQWVGLAHAILRDRLAISGAALESLVEAAQRGILEWALEWQLTWLKEGVKGGKA